MRPGVISVQGPEQHEEHRLRGQQDRRASFMSSASGGGAPRTSSSGGPSTEDTCPPFPLVPLLKVPFRPDSIDFQYSPSRSCPQGPPCFVA